jgi:hypothetical protein
MAVLDNDGHDGVEWLLAYALQFYIQKSGASLEERINIFARCLSYARSRIIKKRGQAVYDKVTKEWSGNAYSITIEKLLYHLDGTPCPDGGCAYDGLRHMYKPSLDDDELIKEGKASLKDKISLEVELDYHFADLIEVIDKENLCSREVMSLVSMQESSKARMKV